MPFVPDDEECIQQMLGILDIPIEIEREYMLRVRMLHKNSSGGPIGPIAIVDMLRFLGIGPPAPQIMNADGRADWRRVPVDTPVEISIDGKWVGGRNITFQGEVGGGTLAVDNRGKIDEFNAFEVRIPDPDLPPDVDAESFEGEVERDEGDARAELLDLEGMASLSEADASVPIKGATDTKSENEVEKAAPKGDIGSDDDVPPNVEQSVNWGRVRKGSEVWLRDGDDMHDAVFHRCVPPDKALVLVDGEDEPREVKRAFLKHP